MKALIISDTHRRDDNFLKVIEQVAPVDLVIHCGDVEGSQHLIQNAAGCPVQFVAGNNDYFGDLPSELEFMVGKYRVWVTHGHHYYVSMSNEYLKREARAKGVDIVMFGHTHRPIVNWENDLVVVNPGSLSYPRQDGRKPSFILMDIDRMGDVHFTIRYL